MTKLNVSFQSFSCCETIIKGKQKDLSTFYSYIKEKNFLLHKGKKCSITKKKGKKCSSHNHDPVTCSVALLSFV